MKEECFANACQNGAFAASLTPGGEIPVARTYAAILALMGMLVILFRAMKDGAGFEGTILSALAWMALLAAIGSIVGWIAQQTVDESVRVRIEAELAASFGKSPEELTNSNT